MNTDEIRKCLTRRPFHRFWIRLSDGRALLAKHPDLVTIATDEWVVFIDPASGVELINPDQVVSLEYRRAGKGA